MLSDIEQVYQQTSNKQLKQQRNILYIASVLIVIAVTLFYIGSAKQVFNETLYEYRSYGVVLSGEPSDVFNTWLSLIDAKDRNEEDELVRQKRIVMAQRSDILVKLVPENKGYYFVERVEGGSRRFAKPASNNSIITPRPINAWLQVLGVLLFASGIMVFLLERRLFKLEN